MMRDGAKLAIQRLVRVRLWMIWAAFALGPLLPLAYASTLEMAHGQSAISQQAYEEWVLRGFILLMKPATVILAPTTFSIADFASPHATGSTYWRDLSFVLGANFAGWLLLLIVINAAFHWLSPRIARLKGSLRR